MNRELSGLRLTLARLVWLVLAFTLVCLHIASQVAAFRESRGLSLTTEQLQNLQAMHLSAKFYLTWVFSWQIPLPLVWGGMGLFIFLRKSRDWNALVISAMMLGLGLAGSIPLWKSFHAAYPDWSWLVPIAAFYGNISVNSFFFAFPTGRFVPRWTLIVALALSAANILLSYGFALPAPVVALTSNLKWLPPLFFLVSFLSIILGPTYRYLRASTPVEKEQIKWVVYTSVVGIVLFSAAASTAALLPGNNPLEGDITFLTVFIQPLGWIGVFVLVAVSIAISILRYRLFDIDLVIRRTLQYSFVTLLLGLFYFGVVTLLQSFFTALSEQQSPVALVLSTLLIAALFNPLRRRVQKFIDHRFYRQKYNAEKALALFAETARRETDLAQLSVRLTATVRETLQPEMITLWLQGYEVKNGYKS